MRAEKITAFHAGETIKIVGYERECECSHCGRALKLGVKVADFAGVYGADCINRAVGPYTYNGRKYRYSADTFKERAIIAGKGVEAMQRHNMGAHHFRFTLISDLFSV